MCVCVCDALQSIDEKRKLIISGAESLEAINYTLITHTHASTHTRTYTLINLIDLTVGV